jgi:hypothetical protein
MMVLQSVNCSQRNNDLLHYPADRWALATEKGFT